MLYLAYVYSMHVLLCILTCSYVSSLLVQPSGGALLMSEQLVTSTKMQLEETPDEVLHMNVNLYHLCCTWNSSNVDQRCAKSILDA